MARTKEDDNQEVMFPELDDSPEHKDILKRAKRLINIRDKRKEALVESKAKEDAEQKVLVEAMHKANLTGFNHKGVKVEIVESSEKVKAKLETGAEDDDDNGEPD
jgi:hypothetical protein